MTQHKERQILFSGSMVRAILDEVKTQTRRIMKAQPISFIGRKYIFPDDSPKAWLDCDDITELCPYGPVGRKLWVRETWNKHGGVISYRADGDWIAGFKKEYDRENPSAVAEATYLKWKPSLFMPRWASRITLEVTGIHVERLNDISDADAIAEGIKPLPLQDSTDKSAWWQVAPGVCQARSPKESYAALWEMINGKGSWAENPYVWVISFKKINI